MSTSRSLSRIASASEASGSAPAASSTLTGSGGSCLTPGDCGLTRMWPLTRGAKPPTTSRTAEGNTFTPRTISMSSVRPMQRMRGPVRPHWHGLVRTSTWSRVRKRSSGAARWRRWVRTSSPRAPSASSIAAPVSGSISSACTNPRAPRCIPSWCSHSPQSDTPMSPIPIASVTRAPQPSSRRARKAASPPPGSPATSTRSTLDPRRSRPDLEQVGRVGGGEHGDLRSQQLDRAQHALGVAGADRDVRQADPFQGAERSAGHERTRVVRADRALARADSGGRVAARGPRDPVLEVPCRQRDVAGRTGGAARRVDAHDLLGTDAQVRADRVVGGGGLSQLALLGERELVDLGEAACGRIPASFSR